MLRACLGRSSGASVRAETFAPSLPHGFPPFLQARFTSSNAGTASCVLRKPLCAVKAGPRDDRGGRPVMSGHDAELHLNAETSRKRKMQTPAESPAAPSNPAKLQSVQAAVAATPREAGTSSSEATTEPPPTEKGMPLSQFVAAWEFRWDKQMKEYPWEWGGDLSEGPFNIIRYGQGPPKNWRRT